MDLLDGHKVLRIDQDIGYSESVPNGLRSYLFRMKTVQHEANAFRCLSSEVLTISPLDGGRLGVRPIPTALGKYREVEQVCLSFVGMDILVLR